MSIPVQTTKGSQAADLLATFKAANQQPQAPNSGDSVPKAGGFADYLEAGQKQQTADAAKHQNDESATTQTEAKKADHQTQKDEAGTTTENTITNQAGSPLGDSENTFANGIVQSALAPVMQLLHTQNAKLTSTENMARHDSKNGTLLAPKVAKAGIPNPLTAAGPLSDRNTPKPSQLAATLNPMAILHKENAVNEIKKNQTNPQAITGNAQTPLSSTAIPNRNLGEMALLTLLQGKLPRNKDAKTSSNETHQKGANEIRDTRATAAKRHISIVKTIPTASEIVSRETIAVNEPVSLTSIRQAAAAGDKPVATFAKTDESQSVARTQPKADFVSQLSFQSGMSVSEKSTATDFIKAQSAALPPEVRDQLQNLMERARIQITNEKNAQLNLRLNPEEFGTVDLKMRLNDGILSGKILVDNESVRKSLAEFLEQTMNDFVNSGFQVSGLEVEVRQDSGYRKEAERTTHTDAIPVKTGDYEMITEKAVAQEGVYA